jgi:hypothetical protein
LYETLIDGTPASISNYIGVVPVNYWEEEILNSKDFGIVEILTCLAFKNEICQLHVNVITDFGKGRLPMMDKCDTSHWNMMTLPPT